jgi:hypothetical protein
MACGPLADAVEGLAGDEQVPDQDEQPGGGGDARPAVLTRQVVAEELIESEPLEEAIEDRQRGEAAGGQGPAGGVCGPGGWRW